MINRRKPHSQKEALGAAAEQVDKKFAQCVLLGEILAKEAPAEVAPSLNGES